MNKESKMLLVKEVLSPLLEIVYLYKRSQAYNYVPDRKEDCDAGWNYFENRFDNIYKGLNENIFLTEIEYEKAKNIITEIKAFARSFSMADGLPERYFTINPNLRFYRVAFGLQESGDKIFYKVAANNMIVYVPGIKDFIKKEKYFKDKDACNKKNNFQCDEDDIFMEELAFTVRKVFLNDFPEFAA